ncbi:MAG: class I SAM-dependent methyltransferase [Bacteroidetes bacterium]|nr:class I SAM-dependent methyltransferase [Bacteroidota bacterium]
MLTPGQFYDALADNYDSMTQFATRLQRQKELLAAVLSAMPARTAIDMGCGTGVHAIALAQLGLEVTGVDISEGMLEKARTNANESNAPLRFVRGDFLTSIAPTPTDLLICLGNSLPHLESREALAAVLTHWRTLCAPGGYVLIQLLNYGRVLEQRERIVNIRRSGVESIIRFYDFLDDALQFNILSIRETGGVITHTLQSTRLSPFVETDILSAAESAGFSDVRIYGSLAFTSLTNESADLVAVLR